MVWGESRSSKPSSIELKLVGHQEKLLIRAIDILTAPPVYRQAERVMLPGRLNRFDC
jgi:hypothetical protein